MLLLNDTTFRKKKVLKLYNTISFLFLFSQWPRVDKSALQWEREGAIRGGGQGGRADEAAGGAEAGESPARAALGTWAGQA